MIRLRLSGDQRRSPAGAALIGVALLSACTSEVAAGAPAAPPPHPRPAVAGAAWPAYLGGPLHDSYSPAQKTITPASATRLITKWHDAPGREFLASPTIARGAVFIGSNSGWFYQLSPASGAVQHKVFLGSQPAGSCYSSRGIIATATVARDAAGRATVYVGAANGYLYALNASNLRLRWKSVIAIPSATVSNYYDWSSPTVANGMVYIGLSSTCSNPLVRGAVIAYDQVTGKKVAEFWTVASGQIGGGVWSSVAVGPDGDVYATTGSGPLSAIRLGRSESILKLAPRSLRLLGSWQVPGTNYATDFGGSPVIFGPYVGACNKDGIFYALTRSTMKLAWERRIGAVYVPAISAECDGTPAYNGKDLFFGGPAVRLRGKAHRGSVQERSAQDGALIWETGLPEGVTGSPTLDGGGVLAAGTYDNGHAGNQTYLVDAATGRILRTLIGGLDFAQSVFADGRLFTANANGVYAWAPR
jgi:outer membrane protein assembly factor BamB